MTGILKNTVILSNFTEKEIFKQVTEKYSTRLRRRTIFANVQSDPWMLRYLRPYFTEFRIEPETVFFHFWLNVLRLQKNHKWMSAANRIFSKTLDSYFKFCVDNNFEKRVSPSELGQDLKDSDEIEIVEKKNVIGASQVKK